MSVSSSYFLFLFSFVLLVFFSVTGASDSVCSGPGASSSVTRCLTALSSSSDPLIQAPLSSFDISWADADRAQYYLADRSNAGVIVVDTQRLRVQDVIKGFKGIVKKKGTNAIDADHSGPNGVVNAGRWMYAGDGDSTLKVVDLDDPNKSYIKQSISTGGVARLDELGVSAGGEFVLSVNNADDPPYLTLFKGNDPASSVSNVKLLGKLLVDNAILPAGIGLGMEQSAWDSVSSRFYTSIPTIVFNGCNANSGLGPVTCSGGLLVVDPTSVKANVTTYSWFDNKTNTGVVPLSACSPAGCSVGRNGRLLLACGAATDTTQMIVNTMGFNFKFTQITGVTGTDEAYYDSCDDAWYVGTHNDPCPGAPSQFCAVLGLIDSSASSLSSSSQSYTYVEKLPQSSPSHSVAVDSKRNYIFSPQAAPVATLLNINITGAGDTTNVGEQLCGGTNGCIVVYTRSTSVNANSTNIRAQLCPSSSSSSSSSSLSTVSIILIVVGVFCFVVLLIVALMYGRRHCSGQGHDHKYLRDQDEQSQVDLDDGSNTKKKYGAA